MVGVLQVVSKHKQPENLEKNLESLESVVRGESSPRENLESLESVVRGEDLARSEVESCRTLREEVGRFRK